MHICLEKKPEVMHIGIITRVLRMHASVRTTVRRKAGFYRQACGFQTHAGYNASVVHRKRDTPSITSSHGNQGT
jgi:hypothetical protein